VVKKPKAKKLQVTSQKPPIHPKSKFHHEDDKDSNAVGILNGLSEDVIKKSQIELVMKRQNSLNGSDHESSFCPPEEHCVDELELTQSFSQNKPSLNPQKTGLDWNDTFIESPETNSTIHSCTSLENLRFLLQHLPPNQTILLPPHNLVIDVLIIKQSVNFIAAPGSALEITQGIKLYSGNEKINVGFKECDFFSM
jgi:hypothetical protein